MKTLHHLLLTSLALGLLTGRAGAEIFPVFHDAAGSVKANTITKAGGTAKTLAVSKTSNAYLNFLVSSAEIDPRFISAARLVIFLPKTTPKGVISIHQLTSAWTEKLTTPKSIAPAIGNMIDQIDLEDIPLKADYYIADVTNLVKFWMTNPAQEFGIAIVSDGVANVTLASKEGFTSGHAAFIEIDTSTVINTIDAMVATSYAAQFQTWLVGQNRAPDTPAVLDNFFIYNQDTNATRLSISPNGNVGIGTSQPASPLHVSGTNLIGGGDAFGLATFGLSGGQHVTINEDQIAAYNGTDPARLVLSHEGGGVNMCTLTGNVGIGTFTPSPSFLLDVDGAIRCTTLTQTSDARYKANVLPVSGALDKVVRLRGVSYDWKQAEYPERKFDDRHQIGFIAQEVREILPDLVTEDEEGFLSLSYTGFIPVLAEALEELKTEKDAEIAQLKTRVATLEAQIQRLAQLEAREENRDTQLAAIHALLRSGGKAQALPASLQGSDTGAE